MPVLQVSTTSCSLRGRDRHEHEAARWARGCGNKSGMAHSSELSAPPIWRLHRAYSALAFDAANSLLDGSENQRLPPWSFREPGAVLSPYASEIKRCHALRDSIPHP